MNNQLQDRMVSVRNNLGKSQRELADMLGISQKSWQDYELGKSFPGGKVFESLSLLGFCADWLLTGEGEMKRGEKTVEVTRILDLEEYALVPRYDVEVSAGGGSLVEDDGQPVEQMAFRRAWLRRLGLVAGKLALVTAKGDSMEPTLGNGDLLLVDLRQTEITDGAIHVLRNNGGLLIKRLQLGLGDQVFVRSDNAIYKELVTTLGQLSVVGRVVWRGGGM